MQKRPVPGFERERIELRPCSICKGRASSKGVFFELFWTDCNGSGWLVGGSKLVLSTDELVTQLSFKLQHAQREIMALKSLRQVDELHSQTIKPTSWGRAAQTTQGIESMMIRKPAGRPLGDTEYLLEQWGWWRMDGLGVPGYTSPTLALMRQAVAQPSASRNYCITDDLAIAVDSAVAKLSHRDQQMGDVIWLYFGAKWPMVRVGKHYGMSEGKARELVRSGAAWVDCAIGFLSEVA